MKNKTVLCIMVFTALLCGCAHKDKIKLDIFYATTCASCKALENGLLLTLDKTDYEVVMHDIDTEDSIELYREIIDELENPGVSLKNDLSVPLIVYRGKLAMVGYTPAMDELILKMLQEARQGKLNINQLPSGVWVFKEE